jgi:hypothetical protein
VQPWIELGGVRIAPENDATVAVTGIGESGLIHAAPEKTGTNAAIGALVLILEPAELVGEYRLALLR